MDEDLKRMNIAVTRKAYKRLRAEARKRHARDRLIHPLGSIITDLAMRMLPPAEEEPQPVRYAKPGRPPGSKDKQKRIRQPSPPVAP